jgi:hypothetical protein
MENAAAVGVDVRAAIIEPKATIRQAFAAGCDGGDEQEQN